VPNKITYQGRLIKSGVNVAGTHTFRAVLLNGSAEICHRDFNRDLPLSGDFTLTLDLNGSPLCPIDWTSMSMHLQLLVDGNPLSPVDDFTSVPYALTASSAAYAGAAGTAQTAQSAQTAQVLIGTVTASQVKLDAATSLSTWQLASAPSAIDAAKIAGSFKSPISAEAGVQMNGTKVTGLAAGTNPSDAVRLDQLSSSSLPAGIILPFAGPTAPSGFLPCDGSAVSRTAFANLFAAIGITWGTGDGVTTFNLPDLRGRAPIGAGQGAGLTDRTLGSIFGEESHTLSVSEMPSHSHTISPGFFSGDRRSGGTGGTGLVGGPIATTATGGNQPHNNMQPSAAVNYVISY
jgi:microcystin-dependent protein